MSPPGDQVEPSRVRDLNDRPVAAGDYVLYWMQQSQRAEFNHALEYAIARADDLALPVVVGFGLTDGYPGANLRHYTFLLEGLAETAAALRERGIPLVLRRGDPAGVALDLSRRASLVVADRGYLRHQRAWRRRVAGEARCRVVRVEADVVVPVEVASGKAEYAARTIRPRIHRHLDVFLKPLRSRRPAANGRGLERELRGVPLDDVPGLLSRLDVDRSVPSVSRFFAGGTSRAKAAFRRFVARRLERYATNSNQPQTDDVSGMSPYLHFGQISPVWLALEARKHRDRCPEAVDRYLEELVVRRELGINFVHFTRNYDAYAALPEWARRTLDEHRHDRRPHRYPRAALEAAETADPWWNAAMREMKHTGFMHNYMRMYWGKKIIEWSESPEAAFETALELNNKYFLDGRDPSSYMNVAWLFGTHDRPWFARPVFGTVRYMAASGLERKCDIEGYVRKVDRLVAGPGGAVAPGPGRAAR